MDFWLGSPDFKNLYDFQPFLLLLGDNFDSGFTDLFDILGVSAFLVFGQSAFFILGELDLLFFFFLDKDLSSVNLHFFLYGSSSSTSSWCCWYKTVFLFIALPGNKVS